MNLFRCLNIHNKMTHCQNEIIALTENVIPTILRIRAKIYDGAAQPRYEIKTQVMHTQNVHSHTDVYE